MFTPSKFAFKYVSVCLSVIFGGVCRVCLCVCVHIHLSVYLCLPSLGVGVPLRG